jgi:two-component system chemotaxis response regulator CheY
MAVTVGMQNDPGGTAPGATLAPPSRVWPVRVLIVDDAASTRRFLTGLLAECPQVDIVGEANNAVRAIDAADVLQPDLVLLDLSMPGVDGASCLEGILRVAPGALVVILSGMDQRFAPRLLRDGAKAFIPKGLEPFALLDRLSDVLGVVLTPTPLAPESAVPAPDGHRSAARPPTRAVVCDDDPMSRRLVGEILASCDVRVVADTATVPNLLAVVEMARPELVVLDLWLEGTPGTAALPELRKRSPESIVIVYSAYEEWRSKAMAAGASAFVVKPDFTELRSHLLLLVPASRP